MNSLKNTILEFWFATITAAVLIGMGLQSGISTLSNYVSDLSNAELYGGGYPKNFLYSQLATSGFSIVIGLVLIALRAPHKK